MADYNYDADGFLTDKTEGGVTATYDYDSQGQLLSVLFSSGTLQGVRYKYDALGRRVQKETKTGGTWTVQEKYLWGGMNQGLLAVYNASNALVMRFEYAGGRLPVAMTYNGSKYYLVYDQVGSLRAVFDTSGVRKVETVYDSFGNILGADYNTLGITLPLGFAGGLHDRHTGLVLFGHRDYDPKTGRWTAKDPIGFAGGDVNLYGYVLGNPISFADPSGLWLLDAIQGALDVAGFFPGVGGVRDLVNSSISALRGNWVEAGISAFAAIPLVGDLGKAADKVNDGRKFFCKKAVGGGGGGGAPGVIVVTPTGTGIPIPGGYEHAVSRNGRGSVYRPAGSSSDASSVRIMEPNGPNPDGYVRYYNSAGEPINPRTGAGTLNRDPSSHVPWNYDGPLHGYPR